MSSSTGIHHPSIIHRFSTRPLLFVRKKYSLLSLSLTGSSDAKPYSPTPQPKPSAGSSSSSRPTGTGTSAGTSTFRGGGGRGIGRDKNPLDIAYYDVLGLESQCTLEDVRKAYRRLAIGDQGRLKLTAYISAEMRDSCLH